MFLIDLLHLVKSFLMACAATLRPRQPSKVAATQIENNKREHKGDPSLLANKDAVSFETAELYLGIGQRQRQKLIKDGVLDVRGLGSNREITTESVLRYLPLKNREPKRTISGGPNRSAPKRP